MKHQSSNNQHVRRKIVIEGVVQGVGFRPYVYQLAMRLQIAGWVCNDRTGVTIEVEGNEEDLDSFLEQLRQNTPPLAEISRITVSNLNFLGDRGFFIHHSQSDSPSRAQIAPDTFVCSECLHELFDQSDRRYRYPFINCTNCGPRFSIVTGVPYDRPLTTMADFPMCSRCLSEYHDPNSRRFHAQPNACPDCGPQLTLVDSQREPVIIKDPLKFVAETLRQGGIVAIKGLGGYHLAVDATNSAAVNELRRRKSRDEKPFALMARDQDSISAFAEVSEQEYQLLAGPERPIVLLHKKTGHRLAEEVAPDNRYFGVMLPYTPLHYLLFAEGFNAIVMTSANHTDEPIVYQDLEALERLSGIADFFLTHNRRIETRTDDSIARIMASHPVILRRSRGFVPRAVRLPCKLKPVLAVGGDLKNTICLTRSNDAFLSQHIGDLKNTEGYESFKRTINHLITLLDVCPERLACDLHPDYYSSHYALEECHLPAMPVQHHHAHLASCLAEHGRQHPAIGIVFDGLGYGADGHIWGGEFLIGDLKSYQRSGHFRYQPMPGGDLATRQPWRMALSYLQSVFGEIPEDCSALKGIPKNEWQLVAQANQRGINSPLTSSCGRLFDAVAAVLGLRQRVSFEGQAAMELEMIADPDQTQPYSYVLEFEKKLVQFDPASLLKVILEEERSGKPLSQIAGRFHLTLAAMMVEVCEYLRDESRINSVVLSGGVFQNSLLTQKAKNGLQKANFEVLTHSHVPPNDGGLALGQAVIAGQDGEYF
ncbi:MAG: carbamoyltransferase HypF [Deltaproteobacteria bacterium]|jgi:hydrogenase maturation protein HypF|nr:carbamoyltransferase HypF [Deltaproteobacteria bacterium]